MRPDAKPRTGPASAPSAHRAPRRREIARPSPNVEDATHLERSRARYRVSPEDTAVRTSPEAIPELAGESGGLLDLVPAVARRALELGLQAREPSFHVFVAAEPEVKVEDDIVQHASRVAAARPTPNDIVYVHDFDHPEAPRPLILPPGAGPALVSALDALIEQLKSHIPAVVDGDEFKRAQAQLASELETKNRALIHDLEGVAKSLGFGVRPVHGGVQTQWKNFLRSSLPVSTAVRSARVTSIPLTIGAR